MSDKKDVILLKVKKVDPQDIQDYVFPSDDSLRYSKEDITGLKDLNYDREISQELSNGSLAVTGVRQESYYRGGKYDFNSWHAYIKIANGEFNKLSNPETTFLEIRVDFQESVAYEDQELNRLYQVHSLLKKEFEKYKRKFS